MSPRTILFVANFFLIIAGTLAAYTLFPYLSPFIPEMYIGFALAGGGVVAMVSLLFLPALVGRHGAQQLALYLIFIEIFMLFVVATVPNTIASALFLILFLSLEPLIFYTLDLLLEATVESENTTGRVRAMFLTGGNFGVIIAPLLIGTLLAHGENYTYVFFTAAAMLLPLVVLFSARRLPEGAVIGPSHIRDTLSHIWHDRDLAAITMGHFILYLFYVWAPLYIPIYFHTVLGIPWSTLGWMFSIMLVPYLLIEYPAGWIADTLLGDKELLLAGFLIAGSALAAVGLLTSTSSLFIIVTILVATRIGAALIESMTEGHFFRRVSEKDIVSVSIFRGVWPLANFVAPIIGSFLLLSENYPFFFALTGGFVLIAGVTSALLIRDSR